VLTSSGRAVSRGMLTWARRRGIPGAYREWP
jgi:hypothetical protein